MPLEQLELGLKFSREWAMPNKWTFQITPIKQLMHQYVLDGIGWIDPFAGENSTAEITNDLNPDRPTNFHMDGLDFIKKQKDNSLKGILYDPPYSFTQAKECYDDYGKELFKENDKLVTMMDYWAECKREMAKKIIGGGYVICCGWNSNGIGHNRGFKML